MPDLSAGRPLPLPKKIFSEDEVREVRAAYIESGSEQPIEFVFEWLAARSRLLPSSAKHREFTWGIRKHPHGAISKVGFGLGAEGLARRAARSGDGDLVQQAKQYFADGSVLAGPWVEVEGSVPE